MVRIMFVQWKKIATSPYTFLAFTALLLIYFLGIGYIDAESGKTYTVLQLMLLRNVSDFPGNAEISWRSLAGAPAGNFFICFVPCILSLANVHLVLTEKNSGFLLFILTRCKEKIYRCAVYAAGTIAAGLLNLAARGSYVFMVWLFFSDTSIYPASGELVQVPFRYSIGVQLIWEMVYGMTVSAVFFLILHFFRQKNTCCSAGIFLFFLYDMILQKAAQERKDPYALLRFRLDSPAECPVFWLAVFLISGIFYIFAFRERGRYASNG